MAKKMECYFFACVCSVVCAWVCFSHVQLCATLWTSACQVPLCKGFSMQEHWSGLPCPPPGNLPDPGIETTSLTPPGASLTSPVKGGFFSPSAAWEVHSSVYIMLFKTPSL